MVGGEGGGLGDPGSTSCVPFPPLSSLCPGDPMCKTGSQDEMIRGTLLAPVCCNFGLDDGEVDDSSLVPGDFRRCRCHPGPSLPHHAPCQAP